MPPACIDLGLQPEPGVNDVSPEIKLVSAMKCGRISGISSTAKNDMLLKRIGLDSHQDSFSAALRVKKE